MAYSAFSGSPTNSYIANKSYECARVVATAVRCLTDRGTPTLTVRCAPTVQCTLYDDVGYDPSVLLQVVSCQSVSFGSYGSRFFVPLSPD